jgi:hypothetical protein
LHIEPLHDNFMFIGRLGDRERVIDPNRSARLDPLAIKVNLTAADGLNGKAAGFIKPRSPSPFIYPL